MRGASRLIAVCIVALLSLTPLATAQPPSHSDAGVQLTIAVTSSVNMVGGATEVTVRALDSNGEPVAGLLAQFLLESTGIGLFGGILGASGGVLVVVGVAAVNSWTPVIEPLVAVGGPVVGALVGLVAGLYPAWRASCLDPVESLRAANT